MSVAWIAGTGDLPVRELRSSAPSRPKRDGRPFGFDDGGREWTLQTAVELPLLAGVHGSTICQMSVRWRYTTTTYQSHPISKKDKTRGSLSYPKLVNALAPLPGA